MEDGFLVSVEIEEHMGKSPILTAFLVFATPLKRYIKKNYHFSLFKIYNFFHLDNGKQGGGRSGKWDN